MPSCYLVSPSSKPGQELGAPAPRELQRLATRATMFSPGAENIYIYIYIYFFYGIRMKKRKRGRRTHHRC